MTIEFSVDRWNEIREDAAAWWAGELRRPLVHITLKGVDTGLPEPALPYQYFTSFYDLSVPAESIVERWDYELSRRKYMGDAFPHVFPNFGPGVTAAFLGARLENGEDTTWFHPREDLEIGAIQFVYRPDDIWLNRVKDIYRIATRRWAGQVQIAMTDLGGTLDILSSFRPGQKLLLDLYDHPDEVKRVSWELHELWFQYVDEFNGILRPANPGYTAWTPMFSGESYYMLQCDFCHMISPQMFDEFVKPELTAACRRLVNPFYHLDGPGQLPHLDSLLEIEELKGVQWIPGAGKKPVSQWPEILRRIRKAGKLIQIFDTDPVGFNVLDILADQLGSAEGIILIGEADVSREREVERFLARHNA